MDALKYSVEHSLVGRHFCIDDNGLGVEVKNINATNECHALVANMALCLKCADKCPLSNFMNQMRFLESLNCGDKR